MRVSWLICCCLLFTFSLHAGEREEKEQALHTLKAEIAQLQAEMKKKRLLFSQEEQALEAIEHEMGQLATTIQQINGELKQQKRRLNELEQEQQQRQRQLTLEQHHLAGQLRTAYINGRQEYLHLLLNLKDPAAVGRTLTYYRYFNRARSQAIQDLSQNLHWLNELEIELTAERQKNLALQQQQRRQHTALSRSGEERKELLQQIKRDQSQISKQITSHQKDEKDLIELLGRLDQIASEKSQRLRRQSKIPFAKRRGKLHWPAKGKLIARYGSSRNLGKLRWQGIVIAARAGNNVRAVANGRILYADWLRGYGLMVIIDHGSGYMSLYGHNQLLYKEVGDEVEEGEVVAAIGRSGGFDRDALYFELRKEGKPVNPSPWIRN
ncbi:MAG: peptidoglycan DD-metalloendopeptidase family protein [Gammaproteobacteria bacterium]|nr:peptidoglycan DD-metalloendopeptidase family protein [Gammaproteobacteria bacterium]